MMAWKCWKNFAIATIYLLKFLNNAIKGPDIFGFAVKFLGVQDPLVFGWVSLWSDLLHTPTNESRNESSDNVVHYPHASWAMIGLILAANSC